MKPSVIGKTIAHGKNRYRVTGSVWEVLMWGWWPNNNGRPEWRWEFIPASKVPHEVRKAGES
jgi:hypothetical protein